jgi:hypothetical protein
VDKYVSDRVLVAIKNHHLIGFPLTPKAKRMISHKKAPKSQKDLFRKGAVFNVLFAPFCG